MPPTLPALTPNQISSPTNWHDYNFLSPLPLFTFTSLGMLTLLTYFGSSTFELDILWLSDFSSLGVMTRYWQLVSNVFELAVGHWMRLAYLVLENLSESFDTAAEAFLEEQWDMGVCQLDYLFIYPSIVAFIKILVLDYKLANQKHVLGQRQIIDSTNQLFSPRNE